MPAVKNLTGLRFGKLEVLKKRRVSTGRAKYVDLFL